LEKRGGKPKNTRNLVFFYNNDFSSFTVLINYQAKKHGYGTRDLWFFYWLWRSDVLFTPTQKSKSCPEEVDITPLSLIDKIHPNVILIVSNDSALQVRAPLF
jgi:hypothetical protein